MKNATETKKFEAGKTYTLAGMTFEVIKRTPCFVTYKHQGILGNELTTRAKVHFDESENAEIFFSANMTVSAANELVEETEEVNTITNDDDKAIEVKKNIDEVKAENRQLILDFGLEFQQFVLDNQEDFETIRDGAKLHEMDACEGYVNKRFDSIRDAYHAAFNKIADAAALLRNEGNRKAAKALSTYLNNFETLGRLQAHISNEQATDNANTTAQVEKEFAFDESILTPENTPDNFEDFTVTVYNKDLPLNVDEDGRRPIFKDVRDAIKFAKEEYRRTGLNVTVDHLNAKMHFGEWLDLPIYSITAAGEEVIYAELEEIVKGIETSRELAAAYEGENGLANKVACTLAYSNKLTPEQTTGALYGFIREAENAGLYDFARKVRFKVLQDCWDSTFNNFCIEDYLKLLKIK